MPWWRLKYADYWSILCWRAGSARQIYCNVLPYRGRWVKLTGKVGRGRDLPIFCGSVTNVWCCSHDCEEDGYWAGGSKNEMFAITYFMAVISSLVINRTLSDRRRWLGFENNYDTICEMSLTYCILMIFLFVSLRMWLCRGTKLL